jgi:hypothetical protein
MLFHAEIAIRTRGHKKTTEICQIVLFIYVDRSPEVRVLLQCYACTADSQLQVEAGFGPGTAERFDPVKHRVIAGC